MKNSLMLDHLLGIYTDEQKYNDIYSFIFDKLSFPYKAYNCFPEFDLMPQEKKDFFKMNEELIFRIIHFIRIEIDNRSQTNSLYFEMSKAVRFNLRMAKGFSKDFRFP